MSIQQTVLLEVAAQFVNSTISHVFLTGKAGTGKTTFLKDLALKTHKNFVIVAPTGIAALNAQGVTIHSQFLLPFGSFIPEREPAGNYSTSTNFYTQHTLARKHSLNSVRKQVLRATDLLIIDEVSMLRADILDAIDYRMRSVKANFSQSFGGTQVIMIGDLYQLPPIVKDDEWHVLKNYYKSMHFFEALALKSDEMVYIELDEIFRQQDEKFIGILNNLRNNITTEKDIATLNSYYRSEDLIDTDKEIVTITTHNYKADAINTKELGKLPGPSSFFDADITGDFPEKLYPLPERIELKVGAQVMFIKNDTSGKRIYFNGKLARVDHINDEDITVIIAGTDREFVLCKEHWENKKYTINEESKELQEEVVGTFWQYPIKLAWAVTVHKSQGLTFEKAIIDVGQAFAPGQIYVALSRLRSMEGLVLRTRINTSSISSDRDVVVFTQRKEQQKPLPALLQEQQRKFLERLLTTTFDFSDIAKQLNFLQNNKAGKMEFEDESMQQAIGILQGRIKDEKNNTTIFKKQLQTLLKQNYPEKLLERIARGSAYYSAFMEENLRQLLVHLAEVERFTRTKTYRNILSEIDQLMMKAISEMEKVTHITNCIITGKEITRLEEQNKKSIQRRIELWKIAEKKADENPKFTTRKSGRKRKKGRKLEIGETCKITFTMIKEGKPIEEIATSRGLAVSTVERHIARGIGAGDVCILDLLSEDVVNEIADKLREASVSLGEVHNALKGKYSYGVLRMVQAQLKTN
ncbi:MAG: helix-turn-helix domain-containing protein [Bacteroidales bacterium]|nr:helix-turn-helix domain-containing protein [Bacteroidales bacterium]